MVMRTEWNVLNQRIIFDQIVMYIDQGSSFSKLYVECTDMFWRSYIEGGMVKSVMAGLCTVFVGRLAVNSDNELQWT